MGAGLRSTLSGNHRRAGHLRTVIMDGYCCAPETETIWSLGRAPFSGPSPAHFSLSTPRPLRFQLFYLLRFHIDYKANAALSTVPVKIGNMPPDRVTGSTIWKEYRVRPKSLAGYAGGVSALTV